MPERPASKPRPSKSARPRRASRHLAPTRIDSVRAYLANPGFIPTALVVAGLLVAITLVIGLARGRLLPVEGRVLDETRAVRVEFQVVDPFETQRKRESERLKAPRVYKLDDGVLAELDAALKSLPTALAAAESLEQVAPEIRESFALAEEQLTAIRQQGSTESGVAAWNDRVRSLMALLVDRPLLANEEFQLAFNDTASRLELRVPGAQPRLVPKARALNIGNPELRQYLLDMAIAAGFRGVLSDLVVQRLTFQPKPMFLWDKAETEILREAHAQRVAEELITYHVGDVIALRGQVLTAEGLELIRRENSAFLASRAAVFTLARWGGVVGMAAVIVTAIGLYLRLFYSYLGQSTGRFAGFAALVGAGSVCSAWAAVWFPGAFWASAVAPSLFVTMICVVVFDARLGIAVAATLVAIVGSAIAPPIGYFAVVMIGAGLAAWRLRDIRSRNDVVRSAIYVGVGLAISTAAVNLLVRPLVPEVWIEIGSDALVAGVGGFVAGAFVLVVLPTVERLFDVTTGMTLSELRDPKQPLLRRLQQMAPGTFNHSHTVATLAEAAADAIGADGLHVYVGALYHDIGKMNKPDYFVENQVRGHNRHSRLSPAMSLLVIVGHVKDGVELAREYRLPHSLHGYIETHHGTTLVEYFFDAAKRQAEDDDEAEAPEEIEYRYPGPRPRTREQAILMLCDCVESATRAMPEPTPSRIAALVHQMATKRLMDGQFDDCNLTLRELRLIEDAITKALSSIYHGRIAYPKEEQKEPQAPKEQGPATRAAVEQAG